MKSYLRYLSVAVLGLMAVALGVNWFVDPYGLHRPYGATDWKPHAAAQGALVKPYQVLRQSPRTLILGNSRAEVGFDPEDGAWPQQLKPVYNLALPGTGVRVERRLFEHAIYNRQVKSVLLGVDFMDFLMSADAVIPEPDWARRLLVAANGKPNGTRWLHMLQDGAVTLASLDALIHSFDTIRQKGKSGVAQLTPAGFNPMHDYEVIAQDEGYYNLFRQRDVENLRAYQLRPKNLYLKGTASSPAFDDLSRILRGARDHGIQVQVVIYPYHAHLLEIFRLTGFWELFEDWKRGLVQRVTLEGRGHAVLWDFSGYHAYAREAIPLPSDRKTQVKWYWEAGHFKKELGSEILKRLAGKGDPSFGVVLTPENIEQQLELIRQDGDRFRSVPSAALAELTATVK
ncbi:MAG: hypothetical protein HXY27_05515 [Hydrogenophilaceae bacterium]|nr:hypothetical protein [Hydrogenophilaceae bacterium]